MLPASPAPWLPRSPMPSSLIPNCQAIVFNRHCLITLELLS